MDNLFWRDALALVEKELKDAQDKHTKLGEQASTLGPPRERTDRDFRKQTIMTVRTLLLENALMSFMAVLLGHLHGKVSLDCLLRSYVTNGVSPLHTNKCIWNYRNY